MAMTSMMLPLGTPAPAFALRDVVSEEVYSLDSFKGEKALLVMFICRHCPYVVHVQDELAGIGEAYQDSGLGIVAISSNDPAQYPEDAPERLKEMAQRLLLVFPFCFDETQEVARPIRLPARRTSTSLMSAAGWSIAGSSTIAARVTANP